MNILYFPINNFLKSSHTKISAKKIILMILAIITKNMIHAFAFLKHFFEQNKTKSILPVQFSTSAFAHNIGANFKGNSFPQFWHAGRECECVNYSPLNRFCKYKQGHFF
jgi:hypothetical protein